MDKKEHADHINILQQQQEEFGDTIDLTMLNLEISWRTLEVQAIEAKINYLRYKAEQLEILRKSIESSNAHFKIEETVTVNRTAQ